MVIHDPGIIYDILLELLLTMTNKPQVLRSCGLVNDRKDT